ncbi:hypothetical protein C8Q77DRAFT_1227481 [Trametes polyzona]|nr:hypothetical protein C8Q77DRAFT_1227481 [Trametes polyzona]
MSVPGGNHTVITGVIGPASGQAVYNRLEINDFMKNSYQFSLYVQALAQLMRAPQSSWVSYFQIAGIHGAPYSAWDGAGSGSFKNSQAFNGYCTHGTVIFPTWHRPYVALLEQEIQKIAISIAGQYTTFQADWMAAAISLRQPYWDWAQTATPPDMIYKDDTLTVPGPPIGQNITLPNPFKFYTFPLPRPQNFVSPFDTAPWSDQTYRQPGSSTEVSRVRPLCQQPGRRQSTISLFLNVKTWGRFSKEAGSKGMGPSLVSLEALHALIHTAFGGLPPNYGHMSLPETAAWDPIFWLHHSQTDRLLSFWLALNSDPTNKDLWIFPSTDAVGTWSVQAGGAIDENTDLTPFYNTSQDNHFWKSSDLRDPPDGLFGYSYPEFEGLDMSNRAAVRTQIQQKLNALYGIKFTVQQWHQFHTATKSDRISAAASGLSIAPSSSAPSHRGTRRPTYHDQPSVPHWSAHITAKKFALGGSFAVLIFLGGPVPDDPGDWRNCDAYVGEYAAFVNSRPQQCANCVRLGIEDVVVGSCVSLNDAIVRRGEVSSLDPEEVVPYLRRELRWRVQGGAGTGSIHPSELEDLEVDISATPLYVDEDEDNFYPMGELKMYHEVTHGRPGGCRHSSSADSE